MAALSLFLSPILVNRFELKVKMSYVFWFLILCAGAWSVLLTMGGEVNYTDKQTYSPLAALLRLLLFVMACFLYSQLHRRGIAGANADRMKLLMKIYVAGVGGALYCFLRPLFHRDSPYISKWLRLHSFQHSFHRQCSLQCIEGEN